MQYHKRMAALPLLALAACFTTVISAAEHEPRHHEAHQHGVARLQVALEGEALDIALQSPAMNIVGFEHPPHDAAQQQRVAEAIALLRRGEVLFLTPAAAQCQLQQAEVESSLLAGHDEHEAGHMDDHDEDGAGHAEFVASYHFHCRNPAALPGMDVALFTHFPATVELEVELLSDRGQMAVELDPAAHQLNF
jgi:hypothetical protein